MEWWELAYNKGWVDKDKDIAAQKLCVVVKSESNQFGEITPENYKTITNKDFKLIRK